MADRIAILSHGKLQVVGSGLQLKSDYGVGYHLYLSVSIGVHKSKNTINDWHHFAKENIDQLLHPLDSLIMEKVPGAFRQRHDQHTLDNFEPSLINEEYQKQDEIKEKPSSTGVLMTVAYTLPLQATGHFASLFDGLNAFTDVSISVSNASTENLQQAQLHLIEFGLSMTSLEEVFLELGKKDKTIDTASTFKKSPIQNNRNDASDAQASHICSNSNGCNDSPLKIATPAVPTLTRQLKALLIKRSLSSRRDRKSLFIQLFAPVLLVAVSYAFQFISNVDIGGSLQAVPLGIPTLVYNAENENTTSFPVTWNTSTCASVLGQCINICDVKRILI